MSDIRKRIKEGLDEAGKGIGKAAGDFGDMAGEAAGFVGDCLGELRDKTEEVAKGVGGGLSEIIEGVASSGKDEEGSSGKEEPLDEYERAIVDYNQAYTFMSDGGTQLYQERERSSDILSFVEALVNSIANTPKEFEKAFSEIHADRSKFTSAEQYAKEELDAARASAMSASGGMVAGAAVASMAPTAAIWIATTFGTASTGTAISTLSGAAASQAALAWLGGGALAAGGTGTAGGSALLALAGPVGWGVAGATLLTSIILFAHKSFRLQKQKQEELLSIKKNLARVREMDTKIRELLFKTRSLREGLSDCYRESLALYGSDYHALNQESRMTLGALVNNCKCLGGLMTQNIEVGER